MLQISTPAGEVIGIVGEELKIPITVTTDEPVTLDVYKMVGHNQEHISSKNMVRSGPFYLGFQNVQRSVGGEYRFVATASNDGQQYSREMTTLVTIHGEF